jgi:hypothetical protein
MITDYTNYDDFSDMLIKKNTEEHKKTCKMKLQVYGLKNQVR